MRHRFAPLCCFLLAALLLAPVALAQNAADEARSFDEVAAMSDAERAALYADAVREPGASTGAALLFYSDRPTFEADNPGTTAEDYEAGNLGAFQIELCSPVIDENTSGVCFDPGDVAPGSRMTATGPNLNEVAAAGPSTFGPHGLSVTANWSDDMTTYSFEDTGSGGGAVQAAGFEVYTLGGNVVTMNVYDENMGLLGSADFASVPGTPVFMGVASDAEAIGYVELFDADTAGDFTVVDEVLYGGENGGGGGDCDSADLEMNDGFAFHWCWDVVDNGTMDCPAGSLDERDLDGVIENAYLSGGTSTGYVCRDTGSTASTFLEAVNNGADGCLSGETDSFEYTGTRTAPFMYGGTWESFCSGVIESSGTWDGTFVKNFAPQIQRATGASPAMLSGKAASTETAEGFALEGNYPNPFNPTTQIAYTLPEASTVTLTVYNALGQVVAHLVDGFVESGRHEVGFDASQLSAGTYLYVLEAGDFRATERMVLLK